MTGAGVRVGVGTRLIYDGETVEVVEMVSTAAGNEVVVKDAPGRQYRRFALKELLACDDARVSRATAAARRATTIRRSSAWCWPS